jgi:2-polyprenyl-6-methoxyphenol hydroxylase-like FAD-dependent oxidoreductase
MKIAICGAGIAGPTLAYWLLRGGHEVTLIEQAPQLRTGGYIIDFWGLGYRIAERMGIAPRVHKAGYRVEAVKLVGGDGQTVAGFSADVFRRVIGEGFTSLARGDLAAIIFDSLEGRAEVLFGDTVRAIDQDEQAVRVTLERGGERTFDLLIGADGQHSVVRELAFGPETRFERQLGYYAAAWKVTGYRPRDELTYVSHTTPGRQVARFAMRDDKTLFLLVFEASRLIGPEPADDAVRAAALRQVFAGQRWETPQILATLDWARDLYFDRMSQIVMPRWSKGRVALVGDAAACVSLLAGEGAGLGMAEAYILAGELKAAGGDHALAFGRYEARLRAHIARKQTAARRFAGYFAPRTALSLWVRNQVTRLFAVPWLGEALAARDLRDDFDLPNYDL